ncbi:uncharacterized protein BDV14DRAFT_86324 [Aspergillus stella-maris]|uniref:uncharacterized protein n=1 Tax=Aspergillus stella-maris TaxID=1810926 RepID=UPI003CCD6F72
MENGNSRTTWTSQLQEGLRRSTTFIITSQVGPSTRSTLQLSLEERSKCRVLSRRYSNQECLCAKRKAVQCCLASRHPRSATVTSVRQTLPFTSTVYGVQFPSVSRLEDLFVLENNVAYAHYDGYNWSRTIIMLLVAAIAKSSLIIARMAAGTLISIHTNTYKHSKQIMDITNEMFSSGERT